MTIASGSVLFVGILPGRQVMVRDINPVETDDSFHSFFTHVMIMQALSDDVLLSSVRQEVTTPALWLVCGWRALTSVLCESQYPNEREREIYTWRGRAGRTNSSVSDSV